MDYWFSKKKLRGRKILHKQLTWMFYRMEQLSKLQIQGFFFCNSLKKERNQMARKPPVMLEKASAAIQSEIGVKQWVMYDVYNLCKLAFENKLSFFKVTMLKEMCEHFEIPSNSRDTKSNLVKKLSQMVEDCSFMKE